MDNQFSFETISELVLNIPSGSRLLGLDVGTKTIGLAISDSNYKVKRVFGFSKKKIHIKGHYYIFKPKNKAAIDTCKNLLNSKISELLHNARKL